MLKSFWLNFVLTVAICLGGLSTISSFADIVGGDETTIPRDCISDRPCNQQCATHLASCGPTDWCKKNCTCYYLPDGNFCFN
jgi:hypothetical protein